jgi:hypothetical protein
VEPGNAQGESPVAHVAGVCRGLAHECEEAAGAAHRGLVIKEVVLGLFVDPLGEAAEEEPEASVLEDLQFDASSSW